MNSRARVFLVVLASASYASAQEEGGISFDPKEVGPDWTQLLSGTGLLVALVGGFAVFASVLALAQDQAFVPKTSV